MNSNIIRLIAMICIALVALGEIIIIISLAKSNMNKKLVTKINIILVVIFLIVAFIDALILMYVA